MSKLSWLIINTVTLAGALFVNYYVNATAETGESIGDISDKFLTLITPADYAFSIWGIIYLMWIAFIGYQWVAYLNKYEDQLAETGIWYSVVNIANALWVLTWMQMMTDTSVIIMFLLLLALIKLVIRLRLEIWDAPVRIIAFVWWPVVIYLGWIILASVVNVAAWLVSEGWYVDIFSEFTWAVIILVIATTIYLLLIYRRNLREAAVVGIWGFIAIMMRHWDGEHTTLAYICLFLAAILLVACGIHGYKNRNTSPFLKIRRGEI